MRGVREECGKVGRSETEFVELGMTGSVAERCGGRPKDGEEGKWCGRVGRKARGGRMDGRVVPLGRWLEPKWRRKRRLTGTAAFLREGTAALTRNGGGGGKQNWLVKHKVLNRT